MDTKHISAILNVKDRQVTFQARHPARPPLSFRAERQDKLEWELSGAERHTAFITFEPNAPSPIEERELRSNGATITGTVRSDAEDGEYHYLFEVEGPGLPRTAFKCFWQHEAGGEMHEVEMGGGDISGPPPSP